MKKQKDYQKIFTWSWIFFIGSDVFFPLALEGALKLKEISYLHAEGYPAGEMKHGPIALADQNYLQLHYATKFTI